MNPREALKGARTALFKGIMTSTLRNIICPLYKISGSILAGSPVLTPRSSDVLQRPIFLNGILLLFLIYWLKFLFESGMIHGSPS